MKAMPLRDLRAALKVNRELLDGGWYQWHPTERVALDCLQSLIRDRIAFQAPPPRRKAAR